jgi:hypothetical protein
LPEESLSHVSALGAKQLDGEHVIETSMLSSAQSLLSAW